MHASKSAQQSLTILKKRSEFLSIAKSGKKWVSHGLIIQTAPNDLGCKRIGYTVSKRVDKSAVKRNRIKRRLRSVAADILPAHAQSGRDYILIGRALTATRSYDTLCEDLKWCLKKLNCLEQQT